MYGGKNNSCDMESPFNFRLMHFVYNSITFKNFQEPEISRPGKMRKTFPGLPTKKYHGFLGMVLPWLTMVNKLTIWL